MSYAFTTTVSGSTVTILADDPRDQTDILSSDVVITQGASSGSTATVGTPVIVQGEGTLDWSAPVTDGVNGTNGQDGTNGTDGTNGVDGADGSTTYFHIAYGTSSSGAGFSQSPTGKTYVGTYVDTTAADSTTASDYTWSLFVGANGSDGTNGLAGTNGADGSTSYFHIAYGTSSSGAGFSQSPFGKTYVGTYVDTTSTDSTTASDYTWALYVGADGLNAFSVDITISPDSVDQNQDGTYPTGSLTVGVVFGEGGLYNSTNTSLDTIAVSSAGVFTPSTGDVSGATVTLNSFNHEYDVVYSNSNKTVTITLQTTGGVILAKASHTVTVGTVGATGTVGVSGDTIVFVYQDATTIPANPSDSAGTPSGWSSQAPATVTNLLYAVQGTQTNSTGNFSWGNVFQFSGADGASTPGPVGLQSANGKVYYTVAQALAPTVLGATSYNFTTGVFTGLTTSWSTSSPTVAASSTLFYWEASYHITEATSGGTQSFTFGTPTKIVSFSGILVTGTTITEDIKGGSKTSATDIANAGYFFDSNGTGAIGNGDITMLFGGSDGIKFNGSAVNANIPYLSHATDTYATGETWYPIPHNQVSGVIVDSQRKLATQTSTHNEAFYIFNNVGNPARTVDLVISVQGTRFSPKETKWSIDLFAGAGPYTGTQSGRVVVFWKSGGGLTTDSSDTEQYNFLNDAGSGTYGDVTYTLTLDPACTTFATVNAKQVCQEETFVTYTDGNSDGTTPAPYGFLGKCDVEAPDGTILYVPTAAEHDPALYSENGDVVVGTGDIKSINGEVSGYKGNFGELTFGTLLQGAKANIETIFMGPPDWTGYHFGTYAGDSLEIKLTTGNEVEGPVRIRRERGYTTQNCIEFHNSNGHVGSISTNGTATSYSTSSDHRLKENIVPMTGSMERVKNLKPSQFNFISDANTTVDGFIAHELQEVVPEATTGTKDEMKEILSIDPATGQNYVDSSGEPTGQTETAPRYQAVDQSKLTPLLAGALKEAIEKIEQLEARIIALEL